MGALLGRGRSGTEVLEAVRLEDGLQVAVKIVPWHTFYFLLLFPRNRQLKKLDEGTWRKRRLSMGERS
ncbi:hypothetical protein DNTS_031089 [Danionella cerebrum]|uniref:Uncharacterized protein n=1 Tax=Danionella cerebrum TaxID=2873325 RepID=A0A553NLZ4_9TELE|nr:hypothetical protein DNTS_031089 [Danionella translucida]